MLRPLVLAVLLAPLLFAACNGSGLDTPTDGPARDARRLLFDDDLSSEPDLAISHCIDGIFDGDETDVDCGGPTCVLCDLGKRCAAASDCASGRCEQGVCLAADPCKDGVKNRRESDVDCGGPTCPYCALGQTCRVDGDCQSDFCRRGLCAAPLGLQLDFAAATLLTAGTGPRDVVAADFNGDGKLDAAVQNNAGDDVTVALGRGDGTFLAGRNFPVGHLALAVLSADFNGDHRADIAVAGSNTMGVGVILGNGDGTFGPEVRTTIGPQAVSIWGFGAGDLNGDGLDDLVVGNKSSTLPVLISVGNGHFGVDQSVLWAYLPDQVQLGDFNRDGLLDVVADDIDGIGIFLGDGKGGLKPGTHTQGVVGCTNGAVHDLQRDGTLDVVTCNGDVYPGKGDGAIGKVFNTAVGQTPRGVTIADFDRDGLPDIAVGEPQSIAIARGQKGGTFAAPVSFPLTNGAHRLTAADFNGDGKPDLASVQYGVGWAVMLNSSK